MLTEYRDMSLVLEIEGLDNNDGNGVILSMSQNELSYNLTHWEYIDRYSLWMYHIYRDYVGKRTLEIGAGMGRNIKFYIDQCDEVVASDIFPSQVDYMKNRFRGYSQFHAVLLDIMEDQMDAYIERFDTILCINVLEHLPDDYLAVRKMKSLLKWGGYLVLMVPAWQKLYCKMDENVGHYRRYDRGRLNGIAKASGLKAVKHHYFNGMGIVPYWMKGMRRIEQNESFSSSLNENNARLYNLASVILEPIEKIFPPKWGLTEVMILEKSAAFGARDGRKDCEAYYSDSLLQ